SPDAGNLDDAVNRHHRSLPKPPKTIVDYEEAEFWLRSSQDTLKQKLGQKRIEKKAKNTIFFLGDGMSVATVV
ncbi:unnamed protein product, partial [Allacma fusca]